MVKTFLAAFSFLTPAPIPARYRIDEDDLARSLFFFPLVGLAIGAAIAAVGGFAPRLFPAPVAAFLVLVTWILATGAFHLHGLAGTFEGLFGAGTRVERLRIMQAPGLGALGTIALVCMLLGKYIALELLIEDPARIWHAAAAMLVAPALGRWCLCFLAGIAGPVTPDPGLGRLFAGRADFGILCLSLLLPLALTVHLLHFPGAAGLFVAMLATLLLSRIAHRRIGGVTGDVFGAVCELSELLVLLACTVS